MTNIIQKLNKILKRFLLKFFDIVLPPSCLFCKNPVQSFDTPQLCGDCWKDIHFISKPYCNICGTPMEYGEEDQICLGCMQTKPSYDYLRSSIIYEKLGRELIINFKHYDQPNLGKIMSKWLLHTINELPEFNRLNTIIIPVPMHWKKIFMRKYNQASILAQLVAREFGIDYVPDFLIRTKFTKSQESLGTKERLLNIKGTFACNRKYIRHITSKEIILVDDVHTTGATINECSRVLKQAGAIKVSVITVARTSGVRRSG